MTFFKLSNFMCKFFLHFVSIYIKMKMHPASAELSLFTHSCYTCFVCGWGHRPQGLQELKQTKDHKVYHDWVGLYEVEIY